MLNVCTPKNVRMNIPRDFFLPHPPVETFGLRTFIVERLCLDKRLVPTLEWRLQCPFEVLTVIRLILSQVVGVSEKEQRKSTSSRPSAPLLPSVMLDRHCLIRDGVEKYVLCAIFVCYKKTGSSLTPPWLSSPPHVKNKAKERTIENRSQISVAACCQ